jgi:tryptophan synthase
VLPATQTLCAMEALSKAFSAAAAANRAAFVGFVTAGYPSRDQTVETLLAMQEGGTDVIELGVPFTDPLADGATIQKANEVALAGGSPVSLHDCLGFAKAAVAKGLTTPVILMGYYNPFLAYGLDRLMQDCLASGVAGFIVVDLPPEEGHDFIALCTKYKLSYVPLLTPTSTDERIRQLASVASSFLYCVSLTGVTGARAALPPELPAFVARIRAQTSLPLAVGFGISTPAHVAEVAAIADGVVVGSAICKELEEGGPKAVAAFIRGLTQPDPAAKKRQLPAAPPIAKRAAVEMKMSEASHFGEFGGRYIPETLVRGCFCNRQPHPSPSSLALALPLTLALSAPHRHPPTFSFRLRRTASLRRPTRPPRPTPSSPRRSPFTAASTSAAPPPCTSPSG